MATRKSKGVSPRFSAIAMLNHNILLAHHRVMRRAAGKNESSPQPVSPRRTAGNLCHGPAARGAGRRHVIFSPAERMLFGRVVLLIRGEEMLEELYSLKSRMGIHQVIMN
jgi:hypothetical protein